MEAPSGIEAATTAASASTPTAPSTDRAAAVHETHCSVVLFLGNRVYKLKKPVDLGFLDFSTRERRFRACHREVDLNRRLAPDVYLGVADVTGPDGRLQDHLVVMQRLPEARKLARLVAAGVDLDDDIRRLAHLVASFHSHCARGAHITPHGGRDALAARWEASFAQVRKLREAVLDEARLTRVVQLVRTFLEGRQPLFHERQLRDAVVDGHGDLLAEDIFLMPDGPLILDCIEFDDTLRYLDRLDDAAFLAMDLEHLGSPRLGCAFLDWYVEFSGDNAPASLLHHYVAYRAFVRAKVGCLRADQGDPSAAPVANRLLDLAHRHLAEAEVTMVLVGGAPGTGKSTTAGALADRLGMSLLRSDRVRKELAGLPAEAPSPAEWQKGIYSAEWGARTYGALLERSGLLLERGESVIVDASWADAAWRARAAALAAETASRLVELECRVDGDVAAARIADRVGISDADAQIAERMRSDFDAWPVAVTLDTRAPLAQVAAAAASVVRPDAAGAQPLRRPRLEPD